MVTTEYCTVPWPFVRSPLWRGYEGSRDDTHETHLDTRAGETMPWVSSRRPSALRTGRSCIACHTRGAQYEPFDTGQHLTGVRRTSAARGTCFPCCASSTSSLEVQTQAPSLPIGGIVPSSGCPAHASRATVAGARRHCTSFIPACTRETPPANPSSTPAATDRFLHHHQRHSMSAADTRPPHISSGGNHVGASNQSCSRCARTAPGPWSANGRVAVGPLLSVLDCRRPGASPLTRTTPSAAFSS